MSLRGAKQGGFARRLTALLSIMAGVVLFSCSKDPVITHDIYIGGAAELATGDFQSAGYWKNGTWTALTDGHRMAEVFCIYVDGADVYAGGYEEDDPGSDMWFPKYWKNGSAVVLSSVSDLNAAVRDIVVADGIVYATGQLNRRAVYWKNGIVDTVSQKGPIGHGEAIVISEGNVFVGGYIENRTQSGARYWKDNAEVTIDPDAFSASISDMVIKGKDIYACGSGNLLAQEPVAKYWKNGAEVPLSDGLHANKALGMTLDGYTVFVAGKEDGDNQKSTAKYWKNSSAVFLTDGTDTAVATDIGVADGVVYVCGSKNQVATFWKNSVAAPLWPDGVFSVANAIFVK